MRNAALIRFGCNTVAALLLLGSLWCILWIFSSYSMAFTECAGTYGLFSPIPRCRQPATAGLLALACLLAAAGLGLFSRRFRQ
jgi:hypothetical protein